MPIPPPSPATVPARSAPVCHRIVNFARPGVTISCRSARAALRLPHGRRDRLQPAQGDRRLAALRRRLVQGRARASGSRSPGRTAPARRRCSASSPGETELHGGELAFSKGTRVALHDQRPPLDLDLSLRDYVLARRGRPRRARAGAAPARAGDGGRRARRGDDAPLLRGAWRGSSTPAAGTGATRTAAVVRGLGFTDDDLDRPLATFSGGELTRASLGRALAGDPDLLLLDEPTNHLDVANLEWLETTLTSLDAAVILVAHDRWFLEAVDDRGARAGGRALALLRRAPGTSGAARRPRARCSQARPSERYDADIARLERFVERFRYKKIEGEAGAGEADADRPAAERARETSAELDALTLRGRRSASSSSTRRAAARTVVEVTGLDVSAGRQQLLTDASFAIDRGEHVALVGPNGSGKTTLLETTLLGRPARRTASSRRTSRSRRPSWTSAARCSTASSR